MKSIRLCAVAGLVAVCVMTLLAVPSAQAQTFNVLWPFAGWPSPANPYAGLLNAAGNLYGTSSAGGLYSGYTYNNGTVFEVSKTGQDTVLYNFGNTLVNDGASPYAGVIRDATGNLYGTTAGGGFGNGNGTVFELSPSDQETILYNFAGGTADGCNPEGGLLRDAAGNLYGTTYACGAYGYGTVFKLENTGTGYTETVLHSFAHPDGTNPYLTTLVMDPTGNLYGITSAGGGGFGTVYRLTKSGTFTVLYSFTGGTTDGCYPSGTPLLTKKALWGTTERCGSSGDGVVWKVSQIGKDTVLHNFVGGTSDGANPSSGVIMDTTGNLYGTTFAGGTSNFGTVYELSTNGTLTLLHSFASSDGENPYGGVIKDAKGNFYGTTLTGGTGGAGTVWELKP